MVGGMRKGGAEGDGPLDDRLLGVVGGPRWSVGRWWEIKSDQQLKKKKINDRYCRYLNI